MDKLENQLKASRQTEISDLNPPVDGWKAISQQLPPPASKTNGKSAGGSGSFTYYWLLGAAVLLMVSISSLPNPVEETDEKPINTEHEDEKVYVKGQEAGVVPSSKADEVDKVTIMAVSTPPIDPVQTTNEAAPDLKRRPDQRRDPVTAATTSDVQRVEKQAKANPEEEEEIAGVTVDRSSVDGLETMAISKTAETPVSEPTGPRQNERARELVKPVNTLPSDLLAPSSTFASNIKLPIVSPPDHPGFRRNGKPKVRPEMQAHLSLLAGSYYFGDGSVFYDRDFPLGTESRLFVLPNGEPFTVGSQRTDPTTYRSQSIRMNLGLNRQTSSGFLFRLSAGVYYNEGGRRDSNFDLVTGTEVREDVFSREVIVPLEAGVQFTFLKRHRFRPYLGVNLVTYLAYNGVNRRTFFDAQTQTEGLIGQFSSQGVNFGEFDLSFTTGFQYKLTSRWSAGLSLNAHSGGLYLLEAPLGVEVRYSLK